MTTELTRTTTLDQDDNARDEDLNNMDKYHNIKDEFKVGRIQHDG
jgi:hypothetical protein